MKRLASIIILAVLLFSVGTVAADPGPNNPYLNTLTNVDCDGEEHDYELLYAVGLQPWFDPDGTVVGGPVSVERYIDGEWVFLGGVPGRGIPTIYCEWERYGYQHRGEIQFAPLP
jgi:hypothetical protein